ncbi:hypothetical protein EIN_027080 [Entamoeba invadens IP1]|uniref:hypothetical protein n=1 Tax=Entamoeba invadens IP1 TaxID=370355 RepID=UPI0002C3DABA|nr:hypothetical protein EIN_027080 [Entamoeba invadens IP1]ELP90819.1 hypothetical protein EIN_027080 [Entamoeba invadens IP1]|eukprot:XP_004257590.1 hypothetical protein EIN_027080 [Entamoeba invadens IP1]
MNEVCVTINSVEYGSTPITIQKHVKLEELKTVIGKAITDLGKTGYSVFQGGKAIENDVELQDHEELVMVIRTSQKNAKAELFEPTTMGLKEFKRDEEPLSPEELNRVLNGLTQPQMNEIAVLTEIGFDQETSFVAYCMCSGNKESAVDLLLSGNIRVDMRIVTEFVCRKYPDAVRAVRPALLTRQRTFTRNGDMNMDNFLFRALLQGERLQDLIGRAGGDYDANEDVSSGGEDSE